MQAPILVSLLLLAQVSFGYVAYHRSCFHGPKIWTNRPSPCKIQKLRTCKADIRVRELASASRETEVEKDDETWKSVLLLNGVAVLFGSQHAVIKSSLDAFPSASGLNFWRFLSSALLFSPALLRAFNEQKHKKNHDDQESASSSSSSSIWRAGAELGVYTFLGFAFQAIGMETTSASKSAFLLYLNVKFVPFFAFALFGRNISATTWVAAALALAGTFLLSADGVGWVEGDVWSVMAAAASALFILRLEGFSQSFDAAQLNAVTFTFTAIMCFGWVVFDYATAAAAVASMVGGGSDEFSTISSSSASAYISSYAVAMVEAARGTAVPILYLGVITTALCNYLQTVGQRSVSAERAAIIYSLDPVYGALFSYWLLGETLGPRGFAGASLILAGVWVSARAVSADGDGDGDGDRMEEI